MILSFGWDHVAFKYKSKYFFPKTKEKNSGARKITWR